MDILDRKVSNEILKAGEVLTGVTQLVEVLSCSQKVIGLIPGNAHTWFVGSASQWGKGSSDVSSLSLSLFVSLIK